MYQPQTVWHQTQKPVLRQSLETSSMTRIVPRHSPSRAAVPGRDGLPEAAQCANPLHEGTRVDATGVNVLNMGPQILRDRVAQVGHDGLNWGRFSKSGRGHGKVPF